jgi:ubiquinone/menaquinone biosynthesis C-methylase UbiE
MLLKKTYEKREIHDAWESSFRSHPAERRLNDKIMKRLLLHFSPPPEALFLDAGCGVGDHTLRIAKEGYRCIGVDISEHVLRIARQNAAGSGLADKTEFICQALEELAFADGVFDVVHCRGVLMHIPDWEKALTNLCRVLKPGGKIAILESNDRGVEMGVVRLVRAVTTRESKMSRTPGGLEFWTDEGGAPFLVRFADVKYLTERLRQSGVVKIRRFSTDFWDINRFPKGVLRSATIRFNQAYFSLHLPASLAIGNAIVGQKQPLAAFGDPHQK